MSAIKTRGEVFTPPILINEMLDKLPNEVWENPDLKWLEPSAGNGRFVKAVYDRLMLTIKDEKHILENMLYMVELDADNCETIRNTYDGQYKLNIYQGSFINYKKFKECLLNIKFDIIFGNPPFQYKEENTQAQPVWHYFIKRSFNELIADAGYLLFVHPSGWRDVKGNTRFIYDYIKKHNLIYLSMNDYKKGQKVFGMATNYDYYLVQKVMTTDNITKGTDIDNLDYEMDFNDWEFIPSGKFNEFKKLLAVKDKVNLLYERSMYGIDKKNMKNVEVLYDSQMYDIRRPNMKNVEIIYNPRYYHCQNKNMKNVETNDSFIFPCVYTISQSKGVSLWYSNINKGHFGVPKVIWTNGRGSPIIDEEGKYGLTEFAYGIVDEIENLQKIKDAMIHPDFIKLMKYVVFKECLKYNYRVIGLFKKDFYNYVI
jgi:hypothetical protein